MLFKTLGLAAVAITGASAKACPAKPPVANADALLLAVQLNNEALEVLGLGLGSETATCTMKNAVVRQDWASLSSADRKAYIKAVQCLRAAPSTVDPAIAPGAKTRYDDFVAVHINQTLTIHGTGNFLTWHRYITFAYEQALKNECGYTGSQPYWNWFANTDDMTKSPVFDGSATSMSGDGSFVAHNGTVAAPGINLPSGNGGGCISSGPFVGATAQLGPVSPGQTNLVANPNGPLGSNPRCLSRDLNSFALQQAYTKDNLYNLTKGDASSSIGLFQTELQGRFGDGFLGMHATGHMAVGGEATDIFSSINDPSFFLHHAMIDRMYWLWQSLHAENAFEVAGTITINNSPPSRDAVLSDIVDLGNGLLGQKNRPISDLTNTLAGPFCYIYR